MLRFFSSKPQRTKKRFPHSSLRTRSAHTCSANQSIMWLCGRKSRLPKRSWRPMRAGQCSQQSGQQNVPQRTGSRTGPHPDEELGEHGQFGHGTFAEGHGGYRGQSHEQPDLPGQLGQPGESHECWEIKDRKTKTMRATDTHIQQCPHTPLQTQV